MGGILPAPVMMGRVKQMVWLLVFITRAPSFRSALTYTNPLALPAVMTATAWTGLLFRPCSFPSIYLPLTLSIKKSAK